MKNIYPLLLMILFGCFLKTSAQTSSYIYMGSVQTYVVPPGVVSLSIDIAGAQGGNYPSPPAIGGYGGRVQCNLSVTPGEILYVYAGQQGGSSCFPCGLIPPGGDNSGGGANGGAGSNSDGGAAGGAASDIRTIPYTTGAGISLSSRIIVAGGGGGASFDCGYENGGPGGGLTGGYGTSCTAYDSATAGSPGTQTAGGGLGSSPSTAYPPGSGTPGGFGYGGDAYCCWWGAGGGGGWYGAGGGYLGSGCGGSSYYGGVGVSITSATPGYQAGNGYVNITINCSAGAIAGTTSICAGATTTLSDPVTGTGSSWSSGNTAVATVTPSTGIVTGVSAGTAIITYSVTIPCGSVYSIATVTVNPLPTAISGTLGVCLGVTSTLADGITGGTWTSGSTSVASIGLSSGTVSGNLLGTSNITYTLPTGCTANATVTINALSTPITGGTLICAGTSTTLSEATTGGTWSSNNTGIASAGLSSGIITGGIVTVMSTASITYTAPGGCTTATTVTVYPNLPFLPGPGTICTGSTITLSNGIGGGTWSSSNTSVATVGVTGVISGATIGTASITYLLPGGCTATETITVNPVPPAITGITNICSGTTTILSDGTTGGTWTSNNPGIASIDPANGTVTTNSLAFGSPTILYTLNTGCSATTILTVNVTPLPISGTLLLCGAGSTTFLSDGIGGGTWSSGNTAAATVDGSGEVYGVAVGTTTIFYAFGVCPTTAIVTVNPVPFLIIAPSTVCLGLTTTLNDLTTGGMWSSSSTGVATVSPTGGFYTVATGSTVVSYTLPGGCATTKTITVGTAPTAITGTMHVCPGSTAALTDGGGGTWTSGSTGTATVGTASGTISGIIPGTATITYSLGAGCSVTAIVTVNPLPSAIGGTFTVCTGATTALTDAGGGTWGSSNTGVATVNTVGTVGGVTAGTAIIVYTLPTGCATSQTVTVNGLPAVPGGTPLVCAGGTITLTETTSGGTWSSSTTGVASIGPTGIVTSALAGTSTITYTAATGCKRTTVVTVNPLPAGITGTMSVCAGSATALTDATSGGTWSPTTGAAATVIPIGIGTGNVTGVTAGTAAISYTLNTGCLRTATVTINPLPTAISGPSAVCAGATMTVTDSPPGGTWSSSTTSIATIGSTGVVTGITTGTTSITYTSLAGCLAATTITVSLSPGTISGASAVCTADTAQLGNPAGGGLWSSGNTTAATVGSVTGIVTGVATGTTVITYSLGTGCTVTKIMTVNPAPAAITGTMTMCSGAGTTLTESTTGGSWSAATGLAATVSGTGAVSGISAGTAVVTYSLAATGCQAVATITVNQTPPAITGTTSICPGNTTTLADAISGGTWTSSNTTVSPVNLSGMIAGGTAGTATITYLLGSCLTAQTVTVNAISAISGATGMCVGTTTHLSDAITGGTWSSGNTTVASVNTATGVVTALLSGTSTITYTTATGCTSSVTVFVNLAPSAISGVLHVCVGDTTSLGNTAGGGTWTSSNTSVATVNATGTLTGVTHGTSTIAYSLGGGCTTSTIVTVNASPGAITGVTALCTGSTATVSDATTGGSWSISPAGIATITNTGMVTGITDGTAMITYAPVTGCAALKGITVNPLPSVTGTTHVCAGLSTTLTSSIAGGNWTSSSTTIATVDGTGTVTGLLPGPTTITYTLPTGCMATATVIVNSAPLPITGAYSVCIGSSTALSDLSGSGVWSSDNTGVATITSSGIVSSVAIGTSMISYTIGGCPAAVTVTVNSLPGTISGVTNVCSGSSTPLADLPGGGTWGTSSTTIANVDVVSGTVTGIAPGMATISYSLGVGCTVTTTVTVNPLPPPITGDPTICSGYTTTLNDASGGGVWSSDNTGVATVNGGGVVHGLAGGAATISYTNGSGGCAATRIVSVTLVPAVTGISNLCAYGSPVSVYNSLPGGAWTSTLATISSSGLVTPYSTGVATITYTMPTGCFTAATVTVNPLPAAITGINHFCNGLTMTLGDVTADGTWSSSNTAVASITAIGVGAASVSGLAAGPAIVSYTIASGCTQTTIVTIDSLPVAGSITGLSIVCAGATIALTDVAAGGVWGSTNTSASVTSGIVSGTNAGTDTIKYTVANTCGTIAATKTITVNPLPAAGTITGAASLCTGDSIVLADAASGGVWSSSSTTITVLDGTTRGVSAGTGMISYSVSNGCGSISAVKTLTVNALPVAGTVSGIDTICLGASFTLLDAVTGGTWSGSNTTVTVSAGGLVNAVATGVDTITYSITNVCGMATASFSVAVKTIPGGITITGPASVCPGSKDTLKGTPAGGNWSSSNTSAVVDGGIVSGLSAGADTIIYTVSSECGPAVAIYPVTVLDMGQCDTKTPSPSTGSGQAGEVLGVWPNPNDGSFTVMLASATDEPVDITITNLVGERVKEYTSITNKPAAIKLNEAAGVYFVSAATAGGNYVVKVVIAP